MNAELAALRDSVRTALERTPPEEHWPVLTAIGVPALDVPTAYGGLDAGLPALTTVATEAGRHLSPAPLLACVLATRLLRQTDAADLLTAVAGGAVVAVGWTGARGGWTADTVTCRAHRGTVDGTAHYVLHGAAAEHLVVLARDDHGIGLYQVDGARPVATATMDPTRPLATVTLDGAPAVRLGRPTDVEAARRVAAVVLAAEQAGAADRALAATVAYTRDRHQFGRPIGSFQALKHQMADLHAGVATAHAIVAAAAARPDLGAAAHAHCSAVFSAVAAEMIQLHGGIGITWEHDAHRFFKRAHADAALLGDRDGEVRRAAAVTALTPY